MKHMSFTEFVQQLQENAKSELSKGTKREMEHTDDPKVAAKIAKDHIKERPNYYSKLDKCMPEETQIDEISHSKAWKYIHKADDQLKHLSNKSVYGDTSKDDYKTIAKRARGLSMAKDAARRGDAADSKRKRDKAIEKHGTEHGIHKSDAYRMRHYPGKTDAELQKIKDEVKAHNKANPDNKMRVRLQNRLGKNNPNAAEYKAHPHRYQNIKKDHAAYHDVYVNRRHEEVEHDVNEAAWADRAADRMGKYHAQSGTTHNLNKAKRLFGDDGAKKYDDAYRDEKKFVTGNKYLKKAMDKRDARIAGNMTFTRVKNEETDIQELSTDKLKRYVSRVKDRDEDKGIYTDDEHTYEKRRVGLAKARKRGVTEAREVDHFATKNFSMTKIGNKKHYFYEHPADKSFKWSDTAWDAMDAKRKARSAYERHTGKVDEGTEIGRENRKFKRWNRKVGVDTPVQNAYYKGNEDGYKKRTRNPYPKGERHDEYERGRKDTANEETIEEGDGFSRKFATAMWKQKGTLKKALKSISQRNNVDKDSGATYRKYALGARKALGPKRPVTEDEEINELSKKTLGRYIKKAHTNSLEAENDYAVTRDQEERAGLDNRQFKREKGINKALNRLTKEESSDEN